jgi:hypothetical protein
MATLAIIIITPAHAFVLTVSHDLLFRQPLDLPRHRCRRFFASPNVIQISQISPPRLRAARKRCRMNVMNPQQSDSHWRSRPRCRDPLVMRAGVAINARRTDETSRLTFPI